MKYSFVAVLSLLFLILVAMGVFLWRFAKTPPPNFTPPQISNNDGNFSYKATNNWLEKVAEFEKNSNVLPTNLVFLEINSNPNFKRNGGYFELVLGRNDFYSVFCVNRVTAEFGVDSTIMKDGEKITIYINTSDEKIAQNIVLALEKYNIHSKIKAKI